jgi:hypothetical protein
VELVDSSLQLKNELSRKDVRRINLKLIDLEQKLSRMEKNGVGLKLKNLISIAFFATINSAIIVVSIVLFMLLKTQMF